MSGAGNETRTRDLNLGKVALYQLSYSRMVHLSMQLFQPLRFSTQLSVWYQSLSLAVYTEFFNQRKPQ